MSLALSSMGRLSEPDESLLRYPLDVVVDGTSALVSSVVVSFGGGRETGFGVEEALREKKLEILCCFLLREAVDCDEFIAASAKIHCRPP